MTNGATIHGRKANGGLAQLLRDRPHLAALPTHTLRVIAWGYGYLDSVPDRAAICKMGRLRRARIRCKTPL